MLLQHLTQRPVRDPVTIRQAPAAAQQRLLRLPAQPPPELTNQPRLAHPGIADDADQERPAVATTRRRPAATAPVSPPRPTNTGCSPPSPRGRVSDSARTSLRQTTPPGLPFACTVAGLANSNAPRAAATVRSPTRISPGAAACSAAPPVDRDHGGRTNCPRGPTNGHITRIHTDPSRQPAANNSASRSPHPHRHVQRPLRVIFMRHRRPEGRHHRVADELLDRPPSPPDLPARHRIVKPVEQRADPLGSWPPASSVDPTRSANRTVASSFLSWHTAISPYPLVRHVAKRKRGALTDPL